LEAGLRHLLRKRFGYAASASCHDGIHAGIVERTNDLEKAGMQIRLATDEDDFFGAQSGKLFDDLEGFRGSELGLARIAGTRATMRAGLITFERQLPNDVRRVKGVGDVTVDDR